MAKKHKHFQTIKGKPIGYGLSKRGDSGIYFVLFTGPTGDKERISTGKRDETAALLEAPRLITETFCPMPKLKKGVKPTSPLGLSWDDLIEDLRRKLVVNNNRTDTFRTYSMALKAVKAALPDVYGPNDITPELADDFKHTYLTTKYKRGHAEDAVSYSRSPNSFNTILRQLRAIWSQWFKPGSKTNPWEEVPFAEPEEHNGPVCPPEEYFTAFFKWIGARYGDWELPLAFFLLKSVCGCRLKDICSLEADQWDGERIHFRGDQTKNRAPRNFLVPKEVATAMTKVKGNVHLWDRYPEGIKSYLIKNKMKASRVAAEFSPQTFISFVASVMKRWQAENPSKTLSTHDFRKRAVTVNYEKGMSISEIADTFGMSEQNVTKSYLDKKRKKVPDHLFQKAGAALMPSL